MKTSLKFLFLEENDTVYRIKFGPSLLLYLLPIISRPAASLYIYSTTGRGKRVCSRLAAVGVGWKIYGFEEKNSKDSKNSNFGRLVVDGSKHNKEKN